MVSIFQALIYSIVQGLTEFLPVSSKGHVAILQTLFNFQSVSYIVFLELASVLAVIVFFWKDIVKVFTFREKENRRYFFMLLIAVIPVGVIGLLFSKQIEVLFSSLLFIGIFFMISGAIIFASKFTKHNREKLNWWDAIVIGLFQAIAILPGVSRSGATMSAGMYRGLKRDQVVRFSFLLAIPTILGAAIFEVKDIVLSNISFSVLAISFIATFFVSLFGIKVLLRIVRHDNFYWFGVYDLLLGLILILIKIL